MGRFPVDRSREIWVDEDIKIGKAAVFRVFDGVL